MGLGLDGLLVVALALLMLAGAIYWFVEWNAARPESERERQRAAKYQLRQQERNPLPPLDWDKYRNQ
ncbi:hypothetical protein KV112_20545 [Mycolicibacter sp. MYC123]|uniref:Uncharacterized protein n=1 Tax=[Mycobacterium] zoologicum TaxID=2872311 RepID=A0ABU5YRR0_9MYCO|nr:hypothetical protein [Mycolicibacter sp. MYC123]MEB3052104.1 hypothetical protein [Mycolicibacter sp. MYC123]